MSGEKTELRDLRNRGTLEIVQDPGSAINPRPALTEVNLGSVCMCTRDVSEAPRTIGASGDGAPHCHCGYDSLIFCILSSEV
jgi:hypothetical protein